jgi:hypothetical protein
MLKVVEKREEREAGEEVSLLDEIARKGALRMLMAALKAEAGASPAGFCRLTCAVRPKSPKCCRFSTCAGWPPAISAPPLRRSWVRTSAGCRPLTSRD